MIPSVRLVVASKNTFLELKSYIRMNVFFGENSSPFVSVVIDVEKTVLCIRDENMNMGQFKTNFRGFFGGCVWN